MSKLVLRGFAQRKVRALLTGIAIVLGVALMSGTYILTDTINQSFSSIFAISNSNKSVIVTPNQPFGATATVQTKAIPSAVLAKVKTVPGVAYAAGAIFSLASIFDADGQRLNTAAPAFVGSTTPSRFESWATVTGHFPRQAGDIAIDQDAAQRYGLRLGDLLRVAGEARTGTFTLVGILQFAKSANFGGASVVLTTLPVARALAGEADTFDELDVAAAAGVSPAALRARVQAVLPSGFTARTASQQTAHETSDLESELGFVRTFLLIFAYVALFVGAFIIFNTFSITVAQRTRELGLLRALGATRGQLIRSVVAEGLLLGLGGAVLGLLLGIGVAPGLDQLFKSFGADLPDSGTVVETRTIVVSLVAGTTITVLAGLWPAVRASRVPPVAALREGVSLGEYPIRHSNVGRLARLAAGAIAVVAMVALGANVAGPIGAAVMLAIAIVVWVRPARRRLAPAGAALMRSTTRLVSLAVSWRGTFGRLARENTLRQPGRTAATAAALMIGVGLVTFAAIFAAGLKATINQAIDRSFAGNLIVDAANQSGSAAGIPAAIPGALRTVPGVRDVTAIAFTQAEVHGLSGKQSVTAINPRDFASVYRLDWDQGSDAVLAGLDGSGTVLAKNFADSHHYRVGSRLRMLTPSGRRITLTVRGIVTDNARLLGDLTITLGLARGPFAQTTDAVDFISFEPGARTAQVQPQVDALLNGRFPQTHSQTPAQFKASEANQVNSLLAFVSVLLALSIIVSLFGIVNTLVLSIFERTREIGMLRAIGTVRRQIRQMVRYESILIALIGGLLGIVLGIVAALILTATALARTGFIFTIPAGTLVAVLIAAGVAGIIAAAWPARRAARIDVLAALATE